MAIKASKKKLTLAIAGIILVSGCSQFTDKLTLCHRHEPVQVNDVKHNAADHGLEVTNVAQGKKIVLPEATTFAVNSSEINPQFKSELRMVAKSLKEHEGQGIVVIGHTDSSGNDNINLPLSKKRAESVAKFLVANGVDAKHITTEGVGATKPVKLNLTAAGKAANRRTELFLKN